MMKGIGFSTHRSVLHHTDNTRELSSFLRSLFSATCEDGELNDLREFKVFRDYAQANIDGEYGEGLELVLLDGEDIDFEADEFTSEVVMHVKSRYENYVEH